MVVNTHIFHPDFVSSLLCRVVASSEGTRRIKPLPLPLSPSSSKSKLKRALTHAVRPSGGIVLGNRMTRALPAITSKLETCLDEARGAHCSSIVAGDENVRSVPVKAIRSRHIASEVKEELVMCGKVEMIDEATGTGSRSAGIGALRYGS